MRVVYFSEQGPQARCEARSSGTIDTDRATREEWQGSGILYADLRSHHQGLPNQKGEIHRLVNNVMYLIRESSS